MNFKLILVLILIGFVVLFIVQNVAVVEIQFLVWTIRMSRSLFVFLVLAAGIITGWFLHSYSVYKRKLKKEQEKKLTTTDPIR